MSSHWSRRVTLGRVVKVYAVSLVIGVVGLLVVVLGGALAENVGREERDPGRLIGVRGKSIVGGLVGFGMGGMSAEFSPLDFSWPFAFGLALVALVGSIFWVRYATTQADS